MQAAPPGGQIGYQCKRRHPMAKLVIDASSATWWPNMESMHWCHQVAKCVTDARAPLQLCPMLQCLKVLMLQCSVKILSTTLVPCENL